jgi:hypothetical protein
LKACTAANAAKNTRMENVVMCCLMKNCIGLVLIVCVMGCYAMLYKYLYNIMQNI